MPQVEIEDVLDEIKEVQESLMGTEEEQVGERKPSYSRKTSITYSIGGKLGLAYFMQEKVNMHVREGDQSVRVLAGYMDR